MTFICNFPLSDEEDEDEDAEAKEEAQIVTAGDVVSAPQQT